MKEEISNRIMNNITWIMLMSIGIGVNAMIATHSSLQPELKLIAVVIMIVLIVITIQRINFIEKLLMKN